jgi:hypothetical protein
MAVPDITAATAGRLGGSAMAVPVGLATRAALGVTAGAAGCCWAMVAVAGAAGMR